MKWTENGLTIILGDSVTHVAPLAVYVFLFVFVVILVVGLLQLNISRRRAHGPCRWTRKPEQTKAAFTTWHCGYCGVEAYSSDSRPPKECKRLLKPTI